MNSKTVSFQETYKAMTAKSVRIAAFRTTGTQRTTTTARYLQAAEHAQEMGWATLAMDLHIIATVLAE